MADNSKGARSVAQSSANGKDRAKIKSCDWCGATDVKLLLCAKCREARYCNAEHQRAAWNEHKKVCGSAAAAAAGLQPAKATKATSVPAAASGHKNVIHEIDTRNFMCEDESDIPFMLERLVKAIAACVMPPGAKPVERGSVFMGHFMRNDETPGKSTRELWCGFYDVDESRLPGTVARTLIRLTNLPKDDEHEIHSLYKLALMEAHTIMGAKNPFVLFLVQKEDPRTSAAYCSCGCGLYAFNGPHKDPKIRAIKWDYKKLCYKS